MRQKAGGVPRRYRFAERVSILLGLLILILGLVLPGFFGLPQAVFVVCLFTGILLVVGTAGIHGLGLQAEARERSRLEQHDSDSERDQRGQQSHL